MTAVNWLDEQLQDKMYFVYGYTDGVRKVTIPLEDYMKFKQEALELEKQQIIEAIEDGRYEFGYEYYRDTYGSKGSDVMTPENHIGVLSEAVRKETTSSQTEISDEEIEKGADYYGDRWIDAREAFYGFLEGAKWYREQVRLQTDKK